MTFRRISSDNNSTLRNVDILVCQVSNSIQGYNSILYSLINDISSPNLDHFFEINYVSWSTTHFILSVWFCHKRDSNTYIFNLTKVFVILLSYKSQRYRKTFIMIQNSSREKVFKLNKTYHTRLKTFFIQYLIQTWDPFENIIFKGQ